MHQLPDQMPNGWQVSNKSGGMTGQGLAPQESEGVASRSTGIRRWVGRVCWGGGQEQARTDRAGEGILGDSPCSGPSCGSGGTAEVSAVAGVYAVGTGGARGHL